MARADSKWMPLYIGDYLTDTSHLSRAQHGSYLLLLIAYWTRGGPLPDDDARLAQIAKCTRKEWQNDKPILAELFKMGGGVWTQTRADKEIAKASAITKAKTEAGAKGAAKRWQTDSTAIAQPLANASQIDAPLPSPSHSPDGERTEANASVATKPRKPRRTRLGNDWQPDAADHATALAEGLTEPEIAADLAEWREYWNSDEPRDPTKTSWSRTYRKHVKQFAPGIIARRTHGNGAVRNGRSSAGVASYLRKHLDSEPVQDRPGVPGHRRPVPDEGGSAAGFGAREGGAEQIIDADFCERSEGVAGETTGADAIEERDGRGSRGGDGGVPGEGPGISAGRGAPCALDADRDEPVVAIVARTEGTAGPAHEQAAQVAPGDHRPPLPDFLRRCPTAA